jgi:RND family efflux transporter MFP subunit
MACKNFNEEAFQNQDLQSMWLTAFLYVFKGNSIRAQAQARMNLKPMRNMGLLALFLSSTLLAACDRAEEQAEPVVRPVRVMTVVEQKAGETVTLSGTVEAKTEVDFSFRIGGRIVQRLANVGDRVEAGQLLARLDAQDEENALRAAQASLVAAEGKFVEAETNYGRQRQLLSRGHTTRQRYDQAVQVMNTLRAQLEVATAQAAIAQTRLDDTALYADAPGEITARGADSGENIQPGQMIFRVARKDGRDAVFDAPPSLISRASRDVVIDVALSIDPSVVTTGRVREVAPQADPVTGTFRVRVGLKDPPADLRLGSTVTGRVTVEGLGGIAVPPSALSRSNGAPAVWVLDATTGTVSPRPVEVAAHRVSQVIVSGGLAPGDVVVTAGVQTLRPGQKVRLLGQPS